MNEPTNESENGALKAVESTGENSVESRSQNGTGDPQNLARWFKPYEQSGISAPVKARESKPKPDQYPPIDKADWKCAHCGTGNPEDDDYTGKYCSANCEFSHEPERVEKAMQENGLRKCQVCGKFVEGRNWCSVDCRTELHRRAVRASREKIRAEQPPRSCAVCGNPSRTKYCSDECRSVGHQRSVKAYKTRVRLENHDGPIYTGIDKVSRVRMLLREFTKLMAEIQSDAAKALVEIPQAPQSVESVESASPAVPCGSTPAYEPGRVGSTVASASGSAHPSPLTDSSA